MNRLELIEILSSIDEEEVLIQIDDTLYEVDEEVLHKEETFDGFYTAFPAAVVLRPVNPEEYVEYEEIINE